MKFLAVILALLIGPVVAAQDMPKKKRPAAKKQLAHKKPTADQIRKFNELQKKR